MTRTCRACGHVATSAAWACAKCGKPYGRVTFGLDSDNVPWQTDSDEARDARFATEVVQAGRDHIRELASQPRDE